jgi:hypothetical protein
MLSALTCSVPPKASGRGMTSRQPRSAAGTSGRRICAAWAAGTPVRALFSRSWPMASRSAVRARSPGRPPAAAAPRQAGRTAASDGNGRLAYDTRIYKRAVPGPDGDGGEQAGLLGEPSRMPVARLPGIPQRVVERTASHRPRRRQPLVRSGTSAVISPYGAAQDQPPITIIPTPIMTIG